MSLNIPLLIRNPSDSFRDAEPVNWGAPVEKGKIHDLEKLTIEDGSGHSIPAYFESLSFWPDGSVKWLSVDLQIDLKPDVTTQLWIKQSRSLTQSAEFQLVPELKSIESHDEIEVDTGKAVFYINKKQLLPFRQVRVKGVDLLLNNKSAIRLTDTEGVEAVSRVESVQCLNPENLLRRHYLIKGCFENQNHKLLANFSLNINFFRGKSTVKLEFKISNPRAAEHKQNLWDLGDSGSLFFEDLTIDLAINDDESESDITLKETQQGNLQTFFADDFLVYQDSSGGEQWQSSNHINHLGNIPVSFKGYEIKQSGKKVGQGERIQPFIHLKCGERYVNAYVSHFWQNFPKAIEYNQKKLALRLFPRHFSDTFELQGGEQKTHNIYLNFSVHPEIETFDWVGEPAIIHIALNYFSGSRVLPFLPEIYELSNLQKLINRGIEGDNNFFEKREIIDEFGWRNFGEIFADHELLMYREKVPLISHYNNQYDALYGLIRQYILTNDRRWFELASDLAQHVLDIDIYHTSQDRDEYNYGLFWHTDHYLNAYSCTHRTFSTTQFNDEMSYKTGGGPGAEHCYTTGLAYFYFLTTDAKYKDAVLKLTDWVTLTMEGGGTVLQRIYDFITKDIPVIKKLLSGDQILDTKYPFTRATGNYITALLDAFSVTGDYKYILKTEGVIRHTVHPEDNIALRNLGNIEKNWSYLIFLQSLTRYLFIKESIDSFDEDYFYTLHSLLNYANWMVENESPMLDDPEILDYPNHTWVAQDLRKANILYIASSYNTSSKNKILEKADFFLNYVSKELKVEKTSYFSRILIILMQNDMSQAYLKTNDDWKKYQFPVSFSDRSFKSIKKILLNFTKDVLSRTIRISLSKELKWLKFRLKA